MSFRPCIDIHNGKVKQVVGSSIRDDGDSAIDNYVSDKGADYYAEMYKADNLKGGHIIMLNKAGTDYYEMDKAQVKLALKAFPYGMQVGGGINDSNALEFLEMGASHVIVTSYVFKDGRIDYDNLKKISSVTGKDRLVLDLSCKRVGDDYYIVTDRWQKLTNEKLSHELINNLYKYCDEFLIHAVDVEGKNNGIEKDVIEIIRNEVENNKNIHFTYAGGIRSMEDVEFIVNKGKGLIGFTIGSALDIFGGSINYKKVLDFLKNYDIIVT
ncbi:MAG: phosphoribosylformimino-5-aminoimidazole carboxamide ribotide isomerase [Lachnospiraceae bacterium]|nr:phosphoribosylformimino-5-aminoimidazole carboxamide ribotide isomerase [Lachnospiraceae bacterium]